MSDYLIRNGSIVDSVQKRLYRKDILITNGYISAIEEHIEKAGDVEVIDAADSYITSGWIDAHVHVYETEDLGLPGDDMLKNGVTMVVDAGTAGPDNFDDFVNTCVKNTKMPKKAYLNLAPMGVVKGYGELTDLSKVSLDSCINTINKYPNIINGVKLRIDPRVCENAERAMQLISTLSISTGLPLIVHASRCTSISMDTILSYMKKGDIFAHTLANKSPMILDENLKIKKSVLDAKKRGVFFDMSHGKSNFSFKIAKEAFSQGFVTDAISTDLHVGSISLVKSLAYTMSKALACGLGFYDVIRLVTIDSAKMLQLSGKSTEIKIGDKADITVFKLEKGHFEFSDTDGDIAMGTELIKPRYTFLGNELYLPD